MSKPQQTVIILFSRHVRPAAHCSSWNNWLRSNHSSLGSQRRSIIGTTADGYDNLAFQLIGRFALHVVVGTPRDPSRVMAAIVLATTRDHVLLFALHLRSIRCWANTLSICRHMVYVVSVWVPNLIQGQFTGLTTLLHN
jgi:hypothetical protein